MTRRDTTPDADKDSTSSRRADHEQGSEPNGSQQQPVAALHGALGNQAVQRLHDEGKLQPKLRVSQPTDPAEREAERVADRVLRMGEEPGNAASPDSGGPAGGSLGESRVGRRAASIHGSVGTAERGLRIAASPQSSGTTSLVSSGSILQGTLQTCSSGDALSPATRSYFEPRFGREFDDVRVHTGRRAAELNRKLDGRAFTHGTDIFFGQGEFEPRSAGGKRLLAHELTHVVQQTGTEGDRSARPIDPGVIHRSGGDDDLESNRFSGNAELENVSDGTRVIGKGDRGIHVTIIQQALVDAGFSLPRDGVTGVYTEETADAVESFQRSQTTLVLPGFATGVVDQWTMRSLDEYFQSYQAEHDVATDPTRSETEGTRELSSEERTAVQEAITTEQRTSSGSEPTFNRTIPSAAKPYEERIRDRLNHYIDRLYDHLVDDRPSRDPSNLWSEATIEAVAQTAKEVTDDVFGQYEEGPDLTFGTNIYDVYEKRDEYINASEENADNAAEWRVDKILKGDSGIEQIDAEHGAVQDRDEESDLIDPVKQDIIGNRRTELLDIHRNWPAYTKEGDIMVQRYKAETDAKNRDEMYDLFETFIHEYIHTLEHPEHEKFREELDEQEGGFVLREGMTDYLATIVWENLEFDESLRRAIEGPFHDPSNPTGHPVPEISRYDEWEEAEEAVGIVGIRNALAAFFEGRTELLGGPRTYTVEEDDTLWDIAGDKYGDPTKWRKIARANDISDPKTILPGDVLLIPRA